MWERVDLEQAIGIKPGDKGTVILTTNTTKNQNRPASNTTETVFRGDRSGPKSVVPI